MDYKTFAAIFGNRRGGGSIQIGDTFTGADGAIANGTYTLSDGKRIVSNTSAYSWAISSNVLTFTNSGGSTRGLNYTQLDDTGVILKTGHCLACDLKRTSGTSFFFGYGSTNAALAGTNESASFSTSGGSGANLSWRTPNTTAVGTWDSTVTNRFYIIRKSDGGCYFLRKTSADGVVRLVWINDSTFLANAEAFPFFNTATSGGTLDNVYHVQLPSVWRSEDALRTASQGALANGDTFSLDADNFTPFYAPLSAGETKDILFRRTDDDNTLIIRLAEATAGTNPNTAKLIKREAGAESELASAARTLTAGQVYTVKLSAYGSTITVWVQPVSVAITRIGTVTNTYNQTVAGGKVNGGTLNGIDFYPATVTGQMKELLERFAL